MGNNDHDDDDRKDLTRIEDLSEFLHEENPELDSRLNSFNQEPPGLDFTNTNIESGIDISAIEDLPAMPEVPSEESPPDELPNDFSISEEMPPEEIFSQEIPSEEPFNTEIIDESAQSSDSMDDNFSEFSSESFANENPSDVLNENSENSDIFSQTDFSNEDSNTDQGLQEVSELEESPDHSLGSFDNPAETAESESSETQNNNYSEVDDFTSSYQEPEKFEEVKTFAQTFSYGQVSVGGNPPFSLIVRNIKYKEDADTMLGLLKEFGVVTDKNLNETKMALDIGSLLIPQISEFAAIVLAHKFRRFDCDIEFGLSEEIHPTKAGESFNKGLTSKESIRQNKIDSFKKTLPQIDINDILVSTTSALEGYEIVKYLGVQSSLAIVEAEELERLKFVQSTQRSKTQVYPTENDDSDGMSAQQAFDDYQKSFDLLFLDLVDQLKQKAFKEHANALLGLNYQMTQLPLNTKNKKPLSFQLVCSATLALVKSK